MRWSAMVCDASRSLKSEQIALFHRTVWPGLKVQKRIDECVVGRKGDLRVECGKMIPCKHILSYLTKLRSQNMSSLIIHEKENKEA